MNIAAIITMLILKGFGFMAVGPDQPPLQRALPAAQPHVLHHG